MGGYGTAVVEGLREGEGVWHSCRGRVERRGGGMAQPSWKG